MMRTFIHALLLLLLHSLDMDVRVDGGDEDIGNKVVFHTRVYLDNVPPLAPHIQIVDGNSFEILWPATDSKSVAPVSVCVCVCVCVCPHEIGLEIKGLVSWN